MLAGWAGNLGSIKPHSRHYHIKKSPDWWDSSVSTLCGYQMFKESTDFQGQKHFSEGLQEQWRSSHWNLHAYPSPAPLLDSFHEGHEASYVLSCCLNPCSLGISEYDCHGEGLCKSNPLKIWPLVWAWIQCGWWALKKLEQDTEGREGHGEDTPKGCWPHTKKQGLGRNTAAPPGSHPAASELREHVHSG